MDALGSEPLRGRVAEIATSGRKDPALGTIRFQVKVALDERDPRLRPSMTAKVDILTATSEDAVTVPIQAVVKRALDEDGEELRGTAAKGVDELDVVYMMSEGKAAVAHRHHRYLRRPVRGDHGRPRTGRRGGGRTRTARSRASTPTTRSESRSRRRISESDEDGAEVEVTVD